jgi:Mycolic acid cyclopropane synthetase
MAELPIDWLGARGGATWFLKFMASHLRGGTLTVVDPAGTHRFGDGAPEVTMVVHDSSVYWSTLRQGSVGLGRDYADGLWDCDDLTTLTRVLSRGLRPVTAVQDKVGQAVAASTDWFRRLRPPAKHVDRAKIQSHYDVSNDFFALMLDETMMYSSAMLTQPDRASPTPSGSSWTGSAPSSDSAPPTTWWRSAQAGAASPATRRPTSAAG